MTSSDEQRKRTGGDTNKKRAEQLPEQVREEEETGAGTRDYGRLEGTATQGPGRADEAPGDDDGGMGGHMGAGEFGNDAGRYGTPRTSPEQARQRPNDSTEISDQAAGVGRTDEGQRDDYGRPVEPSADSEVAGGYGPKDQRAADDTLGGYGGIAGGKDFRPEQQRKRDDGDKTSKE
jgi:hypothetical protein